MTNVDIDDNLKMNENYADHIFEQGFEGKFRLTRLNGLITKVECFLPFLSFYLMPNLRQFTAWRLTSAKLKTSSSY